MKLRVVKLGGSLFDLPDLGRRVEIWLAQQDPQPTVLIAGGGIFADAVRKFDWIHELEPRASHQLALQSMSLAAYALASLLPGRELVSGAVGVRSTLERLSAAEENAYVGVWDGVEYWLRTVEPKLTEAALDWTLTSDSIAAVLARKWNADSLVLAKSCPCPAKPKWEWSGAGLVDAQFAEHSEGLVVAWVNLRAAEFDAGG